MNQREVSAIAGRLACANRKPNRCSDWRMKLRDGVRMHEATKVALKTSFVWRCSAAEPALGF
ncbi:hypothetical protein [Acidovorax sp. FJL06]|uniref:hypothetical protein n=1 Tax=Acidovorax sp. FJL06 TaxID=2153365 RepID=UPI000F565840|nr:hypothetical protein [Acidovorax sp. FJL06]